MSTSVRTGKFDVVVVAGPRVSNWPCVGSGALSSFCSEMGLEVGVFGGSHLSVLGVIPFQSTGGLVLIKDSQGRLHRIEARAIVRFSKVSRLPDPFPGWRSQGFIPLSSARTLLTESRVTWDPTTVVLGSGNGALRFGTSLLERGTQSVVCVETYKQWGGKRVSGWEVERRRFEMLGGHLIEARPVELKEIRPLLWELRLEDSFGIRLVPVARVVSAGPYTESSGFKEHPPGSCLFEIEQSSLPSRKEDVEGWDLERERARWLATKIVKVLVRDLDDKKSFYDQFSRRNRLRLKKSLLHRVEPYTPGYNGKWLNPEEKKAIKSFIGTPKKAHESKKVASLECVEDISCDLCEKACDEEAIKIVRKVNTPKKSKKFLIESKCTGCGDCLLACPSGVPLLMREYKKYSKVRLTFPRKEGEKFEKGGFARLLNRKGRFLSKVRVQSVEKRNDEIQFVEVDVPEHFLWDGRGIVPDKVKDTEIIPSFEGGDQVFEKKVCVYIDGEKRLVRKGLSISLAFFEIGRARPCDVLLCEHGECGLCDVQVDGKRKPACQSYTHEGMRIITLTSSESESRYLCSCMKIETKDVQERIEQGDLRSPEAILAATRVGEGKCHGQFCMPTFRRLIQERLGENAQLTYNFKNWIDWRFPWIDWEIS